VSTEGLKGACRLDMYDKDKCLLPPVHPSTRQSIGSPSPAALHPADQIIKQRLRRWKVNKQNESQVLLIVSSCDFSVFCTSCRHNC
jgi:hypothetical protein